MSKRVMTVIGTRPQFIKAAPLSSALEASGIEEKIIHTGQHFDTNMSQVFFEELNVPKPHFHLEVNNLPHGAMTGRMMEQIEHLLLEDTPDMMLVYGDTNSTLAGALSASKLGIPIAHVESGLRSFNRAMPEETNRILTDHLSSALFCPTKESINNLHREGITDGVHLSGDVMFDATIAATRRAALHSRVLDQLALKPKTYAVATIHRAENTDDLARFKRIIAYLEERSEKTEIIMAVHPRTRKTMERHNIAPRGIQLIEPLGYIDMCWLANNAEHIYTDSGGLQKEAYFHKVPCTTLRDETEWVETVSSGWNQLWTSNSDRPRRSEILDYGDGTAAQLIANVIARS
ncbi:non-hydrolyzing UDP-N-acetylglucosamine 2-epimerase [Maricaulis sp. MIT060901]|uniref:non-hydrolyzing UDP-N-acetylglucosamine 2-epimerase n=1 Tax=Maricaulis sp. MIT060901 TaxID=3096993 RepID=UPI00399AF199